MSVTFNFDVPEIMGKVDAASQEALVEMGQQIREDSNKFAPFVDSDLVESSLNNSDLENGIIVWDTPYARYLYYGVLMVGNNGSSWAKLGKKKQVKVPKQKLNFTTASHPEAQMMWYEKAKDIHCDKWIKGYKNNFKKAMKGGG